MKKGNLEGYFWQYLPSDIVERAVTFQFSYIGVKAKGSTIEYCAPEKQVGGVIDKVNADAGTAALEAADMATYFGFDSQMLRWKDSNHESILFSNATHTVRFLSFDPKALRANMHPLLLQHLTDNGITVGEDLNSMMSTSLWDMLSSVTGVERKLKDASKIMDGNFCLTPDSLMKMLAIFYRVRCGVPVVLLGT